MPRTTHQGRWTLADRFASAWHYLPVEVPAGTSGLRVELDYDRATGAVLDLGCFGPGGFRGWSGNARESFVIARDAATPGYLPGELEAGTWQVMIGVHRVPPDGAGYRLTAHIVAPAAALNPSPGPPPSAPGAAGGPAGPAARARTAAAGSASRRPSRSAPPAGRSPRPAGRGARRSSPARSRPRVPRAGSPAWRCHGR